MVLSLKLEGAFVGEDSSSRWWTLPALGMGRVVSCGRAQGREQELCPPHCASALAWPLVPGGSGQEARRWAQQERWVGAGLRDTGHPVRPAQNCPVQPGTQGALPTGPASPRTACPGLAVTWEWDSVVRAGRGLGRVPRVTVSHGC